MWRRRERRKRKRRRRWQQQLPAHFNSEDSSKNELPISTTTIVATWQRKDEKIRAKPHKQSIKLNFSPARRTLKSNRKSLYVLYMFLIHVIRNMWYTYTADLMWFTNDLMSVACLCILIWANKYFIHCDFERLISAAKSIFTAPNSSITITCYMEILKYEEIDSLIRPANESHKFRS